MWNNLFDAHRDIKLLKKELDKCPIQVDGIALKIEIETGIFNKICFFHKTKKISLEFMIDFAGSTIHFIISKDPWSASSSTDVASENQQLIYDFFLNWIKKLNYDLVLYYQSKQSFQSTFNTLPSKSGVFIATGPKSVQIISWIAALDVEVSSKYKSVFVLTYPLYEDAFVELKWILSDQPSLYLYLVPDQMSWRQYQDQYLLASFRSKEDVDGYLMDIICKKNELSSLSIKTTDELQILYPTADITLHESTSTIDINRYTMKLSPTISDYKYKFSISTSLDHVFIEHVKNAFNYMMSTSQTLMSIHDATEDLIQFVNQKTLEKNEVKFCNDFSFSIWIFKQEKDIYLDFIDKKIFIFKFENGCFEDKDIKNLIVKAKEVLFAFISERRLNHLFEGEL